MHRDFAAVLSDVCVTDGWRIEEAGDRLRIFAPNGDHIQVNPNLADDRAVRNVRVFLRKVTRAMEAKKSKQPEVITIRRGVTAQVSEKPIDAKPPSVLTFGAALKAAIAEAGMTYKTTAELLDYSAITIEHIAEQEKRPSRELLDKLIDVFPQIAVVAPDRATLNATRKKSKLHAESPPAEVQAVAASVVKQKARAADDLSPTQQMIALGMEIGKMDVMQRRVFAATLRVAHALDVPIAELIGMLDR